MQPASHQLPTVTVTLRQPMAPQLTALQCQYPVGTEVIVVPDTTPYRFRCRVHSSDIPVVFDTLVGLYHVPPVPLPEAPRIVDLGVNIGCTMVHYASLYPGARIVGVELDADNVRLATINTAAVPTSTLVHAAIWPTDGFVNYSGEEAWGYRVTGAGPRTVQAISMTTLMGAHGLTTIDFLKVDIEGGEKDLFSGALPWLTGVRVLAVEVHDNEPFLTELVTLLTRHGFVAQRDPHHWSAVIAGRPGSL
jgi:FkbM family methyltransferase